MKRSPFWLLAALILFALAPPLCAADDEDKEKDKEAEEGEKAEAEEKPKGFRTFTAKNGKSLEARVLARIDDERYTVETPEGKNFTLNISSLSKSDQRFLEFWEPHAILDLKAASLEEVLGQMGYSALPLTTVDSLFFVTATVDGKEGKFLLDPTRAWSFLDPAAAGEIGMNLAQGNINFTDGSRSQQGSAKELRVGEVALEAIEFQVVELTKLFRSVPANTLGTIGSDLVLKLNAVVDYQDKHLFVRKDK